MSSSITRFDLITLGESMWRLSTPGYLPLELARTLDVNVGGAESNVAAALSNLGKRVSWWSRLPDNPLGRHIAHTLQAYGVDVSYVCWGGDRLGTYFIEYGSPPRPTQVIYDRAHSAASQMQPSDFPWHVLAQARWLHLTGITPALSHSCLETVRRAIHEAHTAGITISFDLNYRARLWTVDEARPIYDELAALCTPVFGAERDIRSIWGADITLEELHDRWQGATVILTRGEVGAQSYDGHRHVETAAFPVQIVDRIGAGDAFATGVIYSLMEGKSLPDALRYGAALAAIKLTMPGDIPLVSARQVEELLATAGASPSMIVNR